MNQIKNGLIIIKIKKSGGIKMFNKDKSMVENLDKIDMLRTKILLEKREVNEACENVANDSKLLLELTQYISKESKIKALILAHFDGLVMLVDDLIININTLESFIQRVYKVSENGDIKTIYDFLD